jgi:valyl-tRNA synthetase
MPHITEEIYQAFYAEREKNKSIHLSGWPAYDKAFSNKKIERLGDEIIDMIAKVRHFKTANKKSMKEPVVLTINMKRYKAALEDIKAAANAKEITDGKFDVGF